MNKNFIGDDFLLENDHAQMLYHEYANKMPIIDYHNHLSAQQIAEDKIFDNISEVWIGGDHYKWRAMRTLGIDEKYITGDASPQEKFQKWAYAVPYTLRNPLYHWTHLELARYFDVHQPLSDKNADEIYADTTEKLRSPSHSCQNLLKKMNVEVLCTTEDPTDTLEYHQALEKSGNPIKVSTAFRPDKAILIGNEGYNAYLEELGKVCQKNIDTYDALCDALVQRMDYFNENGCKLSDHGLNYIPFQSIYQERGKGHF